jgi:hypothetical protein
MPAPLRVATPAPAPAPVVDGSAPGPAPARPAPPPSSTPGTSSSPMGLPARPPLSRSMSHQSGVGAEAPGAVQPPPVRPMAQGPQSGEPSQGRARGGSEDAAAGLRALEHMQAVRGVCVCVCDVVPGAVRIPARHPRVVLLPCWVSCWGTSRAQQPNMTLATPFSPPIMAGSLYPMIPPSSSLHRSPRSCWPWSPRSPPLSSRTRA